MSSQMPDFQVPADIYVYGIAGIAVALIVLVKLFQPSKLDTIPTVGSSGWLDSWWAGLKYFANAHEIIQEGYEKHKSSPFKVAQIYRWLVVLSSREHVEELRKTPEEVMSFLEAANKNFHIEYTLGREVHHNRYHIPIVRGQLTRSVGLLYADIRDEQTTALDDILNLSGYEWKDIPVFDSVQRVVCRMSNRVFVGLPLCRDPEWIDLNIRFTLDVIKGGILIGMFPTFLWPVIARFCTNLPQNNLCANRLLGPIIEERQRYLKEYGNDWAEKPNDVLSWLMDAAKGQELTTKCLITRILGINFAAIHTTAQSFSHVLLYLAANPQYIQPLREEVESIVEKEGWTKTSLGKMRKIDSFLKECQRLEGLGSLIVLRLAMKDYTFADGTFIPKGTMVSVASGPIHHDDAFYENANAFEPFRFAKLGDGEGEGAKYSFATTATEYLAFGLGRSACPGRFFASCGLKSMLAHIVVTYDIKLPDNTSRPRSMRVAAAAIPDPNAKVMFRRRVQIQ